MPLTGQDVAESVLALVTGTASVVVHTLLWLFPRLFSLLDCGSTHCHHSLGERSMGRGFKGGGGGLEPN